MTTTQVAEMSVTVKNSPIQDCIHLDNHTQPTYTVWSAEKVPVVEKDSVF